MQAINVFVNTLILVGLAPINAMSMAAEKTDFGYWLEPETGMQVHLYICDEEAKFSCGRIHYVPATQSGTDINNTEPSLRARSLRDLEIIGDFQPVTNNVWEGGGEYGKVPGRIYLPVNGDTLDDHKNRYRVSIRGKLISIRVANRRFINCFRKSDWHRLEARPMDRERIPNQSSACASESPM